MVNVRFELTTNDPWSVDDAICEGISPLGYWQKVNQSPTQTKPYNTYCKETGLRHRVSPCRSAYFASPWWLLTLASLT